MTPSVTRVLGVFADYSNVPGDGRLAEAADRGTRLHRACVIYSLELDESGFKPHWMPPQDIQLHFLSFRKWHALMVERLLHAELELTHPVWGYIGHLDFLFQLKTGETVLIDLKTPVTKSRLWAGQLAAYGELCRANNIPYQRSGVLQTHPGGDMARITWYSDQARDLNAFLAALTAYKYFKEK